MPTDPCDDRPIPDHLVWRGTVYDVSDATAVETEDGATLLEVWATERGEGSGKPE